MDNLVSIIIPCYNAENTIERSIKSALRQSYRNIEIIVINDGSADRSEKIVQNMALKYENIILITTKNKGVGAARNRGILSAKGKYIAFLDADDIYAKDFIKTLVFGIEHGQSDTAYCKWTRGNFDGNTVYHEEDPYTFLKKQMLKRKYKVSFFNYLYRYDRLHQNNIFFPTDLKYGEDNVFIVEYLTHCKKAVSVNASLYRYCNNIDSAMHNATWCMADGLEAVKRIEKLLVNTTIYDEYCRFAFSRTVWAKAKDFAKANEYMLFLKLDKEFNVKKHMKQLIKQADTEAIVRISAVIYCINKVLFYKIISRIID